MSFPAFRATKQQVIKITVFLRFKKTVFFLEVLDIEIYGSLQRCDKDVLLRM